MLKRRWQPKSASAIPPRQQEVDSQPMHAHQDPLHRPCDASVGDRVRDGPFEGFEDVGVGWEGEDPFCELIGRQHGEVE